MQEDIEDATRWLIEQGIADPKRIALSGASYGGYASLMGLAKTPNLYACAIAGLAVTDLNLLMTSGQGDIPQSKFGLALWKALVGDPKTEREQLALVSPVNLASAIRAPVLMYSGGADIRVPIEQPDRMRRALEKEGRSVKYIVHQSEGHGFGALSANVSTYREIFRFLSECFSKETK